MAYTGCDGVMTSEAILENPGLFANRWDPARGVYSSQVQTIIVKLISLSESLWPFLCADGLSATVSGVRAYTPARPAGVATSRVQADISMVEG